MSAKTRDENSGKPKLDRERLLNDILNTGVNGALIGGFALGNMQMEYESPEWPLLDVAIYMTSFVGVHACTCACVTSALLYRVANRLPDLAAPDWAQKNKVLLMMPMAKFGMGCVAYLCSVVLISFRDLEAISLWRYIALVVGLMSMSMTLGVAVIVGRAPSSPAAQIDTPEDLSRQSQDEAGDVAKMAQMLSKIVSILEKVAVTSGRGAATAVPSSKRKKSAFGEHKKQHKGSIGGFTDRDEVPGRLPRLDTTAWTEKRRRPSFG